jgi:hypothetical protein
VTDVKVRVLVPNKVERVVQYGEEGAPKNLLDEGYDDKGVTETRGSWLVSYSVLDI